MELYRVISRQCKGAARKFRRVVGNGGDGEFVAERVWFGVMQIPDEAMHAWLTGENFFAAHPVHGNRIAGGDFFHVLRFVVAGIAADEMVLRVEDFQRHGTTGRARLRRKVVVDDRAVRGILPRWRFRRQWRIGVAAPAETNSGLRRE